MPHSQAPSIPKELSDKLKIFADGAHQQYSKKELRRLMSYMDSVIGGRPSAPEGSQQRPWRGYFPELRAQRFWTSADCAWLEKVETVLRSCEAMPREVKAHRKTVEWSSYSAAIRYPDLKTDTWTVEELYNQIPNNRAKKIFPETVAALESINEYIIGEAAFLCLAPHTTIPMHTDNSNTQLTCLYGIVVPSDCGIHVAGEERLLQERSALFFDHSFPHHPWNNSDQARIVLLVDLVHPDLSPVEVRLIRQWNKIAMEPPM